MDMRKVAVLGAGTMGPGIATSYCVEGSLVGLYTRSQKTLDTAKAVIASNLELYVQEGILTREAAEAALGRITFTTCLEEAVQDAWYIAETVVEKPEVKQALYTKLDAILPPEVIIASNTSYLNVFELMPRRRLPYTAISHFYAPAHILPLVEVVRGEETLEAVMDKIMEYHRHCGKTPVRMEKYIPGFIVNRLQSAMHGEVMHLIENGYCSAEEMDLAVKTSLMPRGLLLGLVQRLDFNGLDMCVNAMKNKAYAPPPPTPHPEIIFSHTDKGEYGAKTGKGIYDYSHMPYEQLLQQRDRMLLRSVALAEEFLQNPLHNTGEE